MVLYFTQHLILYLICDSFYFWVLDLDCIDLMVSYFLLGFAVCLLILNLKLPGVVLLLDFLGVLIDSCLSWLV